MTDFLLDYFGRAYLQTVKKMLEYGSINKQKSA